MEHKICEYCGTEYDASLEECPLCGKVNEAMDSAAPSSSRGKGARLAPKEDKIPRGLQIVICIVLGLAVYAYGNGREQGALYRQMLMQNAAIMGPQVQQALDESKVPAPEKKLFLLIRTGISLMMYHNVV